MSLSSVLNTAQSSLTNTSRQTSVVSRNITNAYNTDYTRRQAVLASTAPGARVVSITRAADAALMRQNSDALSVWHAQNTLATGYERLSLSVNGVENSTSPAMRLGELQMALQTYSASPGDRSLAVNVVNSAGDMVRTLNGGTTAIQQLRTDADGEIKQSVDKLNSLLADLEKINTDVMTATRLGRDASESLDLRDGIVKQISEIVPVTTQLRGDSDMVIFTKDGVTLFETVARKATFEPSPMLLAGQSGNQVYIDGVPLSAGQGGDTDAGGNIAGLLQLRDTVAPQMQNQLDEIARALVDSFKEAEGPPRVNGLFTFASAQETAGTLIVNQDYVTNPHAIRDGADGSLNPVPPPGTPEASFTGQITRLMDGFDADRTFSTDGGIEGARSLSAYATASISWLESQRQLSSVAAEKKSATLTRTSEALSNKTGVNIDDELAKLLELEQSYAASAKLMQVANDMLSTLMATVR
ncbi:MAG: flagellar hook-associated protein FlgK [Aliihoeflea sp.]|uniref:flagellar hook-associated protein FlgK n=1 Tax=Aliihoeflea sp. TaxID=2608088 RepID=UPI0040332A60